MGTERTCWEGGAAAKIFWCGYYAAGLIGSLLVHGLLQERIMQRPYNGEVFSHSVFFIMGVVRIGGFLFALLMCLVKGESLANGADMWNHVCVSFSSIAEGACTLDSLRFISFGMVQLGKSFKMIPVMIWAFAISGKRYPLSDWVVAALVSGGITDFMCTGPRSASSGASSSIVGFVLLLCAIALDGLTVSMSEWMFVKRKTTTFNQMMWTHGVSCFMALAPLAMTDQLVPALRFTCSHKDFLWDILGLSACWVASQYFVFSMTKDFGALVLAACTNVRQVLTILLSYVAYHHHITPAQVLGLCVVFGALFYRSAANLMGLEMERREVESPRETRSASAKDA